VQWYDARYLVVPCNGAVEKFDRNLVSKLRIKTTNCKPIRKRANRLKMIKTPACLSQLGVFYHSVTISSSRPNCFNS
jgi:hypothetical protein